MTGATKEERVSEKAFSPKTVKTIDDLCRMESDNHSAGDFWILVSPPDVTIAAQRVGERCTAMITMPRSKFDKLIAWYQREQKLLAD